METNQYIQYGIWDVYFTVTIGPDDGGTYKQSGSFTIESIDQEKDANCRTIALNDEINNICIDFVDNRNLDSEDDKQMFGKEVDFDRIDFKGRCYHDMTKGLTKLQHQYPSGQIVDIDTDQCLVSEAFGCKADSDCKGDRTCGTTANTQTQTTIELVNAS